mmetsp:Transcript_73744/g.185871  ORF Transcript_73744/g.185871 Transcript_73744/m.185871 type:complete len:101 (-) Transcript_73744:214-516(-)
MRDPMTFSELSQHKLSALFPSQVCLQRHCTKNKSEAKQRSLGDFATTRAKAVLRKSVHKLQIKSVEHIPLAPSCAAQGRSIVGLDRPSRKLQTETLAGVN